MKENNDHYLRSVSSFSDFEIERKRLQLKKKLIEARLQFNANQLKEIFTLKKDLPFDYIQEIMEKFSGIFEKIFKAAGRTGTNETSSEN